MPTKILLCALLCAITILSYCQTLQYPLTGLDIADYLTQNHHVSAGLTPESIRWALTASHAGNWFPLTWLSHMLDVQLFGMKPMGHHLVSLLLHTANSVLLFLLFSFITKTTWRSLFVAALFALHPLHVESVTWVAERKDVFSTFFLMLTLFSYGIGVIKQKRSWYALSLLFFAMGLMAKQMLVSVPIILLLLDFWPLRRKEGLQRLILEKLPFALLSAVASFVALNAQKMGGTVAALTNLPLHIRMANAFISYAGYIRKMIWPFDLAAYYPLTTVSMALAGVLCVVLAGITFLVNRERQRFPYLLTGWFWYLVTLIPVIGIVQVGDQAMADRYSYIPLIGLFVIVSWGLADVCSLHQHLCKAVRVFSLGVLVACVVLTLVQNSYWKDNITLFSHTLDVTNDNYMAHIFLGNALRQKGDSKAALEQYNRALHIRPGFDYVHTNLGLAYEMEGRYDQAIAEYLTALHLRPDDDKTHYFLGVALDNQGRNQEAIQHLGEAVRLNPDFAEAHYDLAIALDKSGRTSSALAEYSACLRINPGFADCHNNFGELLLRMGRIDDAIQHFYKALLLNPDLETAQRGLQTARQKLAP